MKQDAWDLEVAELRKQVLVIEKKVQQKEQEENARKEKEIFETSVTIVKEVVKRIDETLTGVILTLPRDHCVSTYAIGNQLKDCNKKMNPSQVLLLLEASRLEVTEMKEQKFTDLAIDVKEFCSFEITLKKNN